MVPQVSGNQGNGWTEERAAGSRTLGGEHGSTLEAGLRDLHPSSSSHLVGRASGAHRQSFRRKQ